LRAHTRPPEAGHQDCPQLLRSFAESPPAASNGKATLSLSGCSVASPCSGPQRWNSFENFRDEKLSLRLRHVLGYDVSINPQTKRCLKVARHLFFDHDLAQHRSSKVLRRFLCPLPCGTPHASRSWSGMGQSAQYDDSSDDTGGVCVDIPSCVSSARAHQDSHVTGSSIASRSRR
jgi:hypothetical protein